MRPEAPIMKATSGSSLPFQIRFKYLVINSQHFSSSMPFGFPIRFCRCSAIYVIGSELTILPWEIILCLISQLIIGRKWQDKPSWMSATLAVVKSR
jgi:hypothetical protein